MIKKLIFNIFLFASCICSAQNIHYARSIIDTLTSKQYFGRGYVNNGSNKAAHFITNEFKKAGALSFKNNYHQQFTMSVNAITECIIENGELIPAKDFIVSSMSGSKQGKFKLHFVTEQDISSKERASIFLSKNYSSKIVVFSSDIYDNPDNKPMIYGMIFSNMIQAEGIIVGTNSLPNFDVQLPVKPFSFPLIYVNTQTVDLASYKQISINIKTKHDPKYSVLNVAAYLKGTMYPDSFLVFTAHYDHLGMMGEILFPGANDNASGVAMMLDLMNYYTLPENRLPYSVAFIAFAAEEAGLLGSTHFVKKPMFPIPNIKFLWNLDIIGTGKEGVQVVNGSVFTTHFEILTQINNENNYLPEIKTRGEACNSDHCPFYKKGVPSFFIYTLDKDYTWYHVPEDEPSRLPLDAYENLFRLIRDFCANLH